MLKSDSVFFALKSLKHIKTARQENDKIWIIFFYKTYNLQIDAEFE